MSRKLRSLLCTAAAVLLTLGTVSPAQAGPRANWEWWMTIRSATATTTADRLTATADFTIGCDPAKNYTIWGARLYQPNLIHPDWADFADATVDNTTVHQCGSQHRITLGAPVDQNAEPTTWVPGAATVYAYIVLCMPDGFNCNWNVSAYKDVTLKAARR